MPEFKFIKTLDLGTVVADTTAEASWSADENYLIKRIMVKSKDGAELNASTLWFKIAGRVYTRAVTPASYLGPDILVTPVLNIDFPRGSKLDLTFENLEGADKDIYIYFEVHAPKAGE